jgi:putative acetyltransferase
LEVDGGRLEALYVRPDFAGRGLGSTLLLHAEALIRSGGHATASLEASPNAEGFYLKRGYELQPHLSPKGGSSMIKQLDNPSDQAELHGRRPTPRSS